MPADASAAAVALSRQRRIGLRVALAVAAGFTLNLATGEVVPFFGPVLAVQFLIFGAGPLPLSKAMPLTGVGTSALTLAPSAKLVIKERTSRRLMGTVAAAGSPGSVQAQLLSGMR